MSKRLPNIEVSLMKILITGERRVFTDIFILKLSILTLLGF